MHNKLSLSLSHWLCQLGQMEQADIFWLVLSFIHISYVDTYMFQHM